MQWRFLLRPRHASSDRPCVKTPQRIKVRGNLDRALQVEKILKQEREKIERAGSLANPPDAVDGTFAGEDGGKKKSGRGGWLFISKKPPRAKL